MWLVLKILSWLVHAAVVMMSIAAVSPGNPANTLGRALLVTCVVAVVVTPFAWFWFVLFIPALIALFAWCAVYWLAYGLGFFQAVAAALVQAALGLAVDYFLPRHLHYH